VRRWSGACLVAAVACLLVISSQTPSPVVGASPDSSGSYPNVSWALGVVVPEGSELQGGGSVKWETVTNVTAEVTLPNITNPDRNVYAIMSVMTEKGAVLQAAAGALPNRSVWLTFAWFVPDASSAQLEYDWILNASEPSMEPDSRIMLSFFEGPAGWTVKVAAEGSGSSVQKAFPPGSSGSLLSGDQEVFALESYSKAQSTFSEMGNLTLDELLLNGERVVGGFYTYSQWDPLHNPLFVVGSSGSSLPTFINIGKGEDGTVYWEYSVAWESVGGTLAGVEVLAIVGLLGAAVASVAVALWAFRNRRSRAARP